MIRVNGEVLEGTENVSVAALLWQLDDPDKMIVTRQRRRPCRRSRYKKSLSDVSAQGG